MSNMYILNMDPANSVLSAEELAVVNTVFDVALGTNDTLVLTVKSSLDKLLAKLLSLNSSLNTASMLIDNVLNANFETCLSSADKTTYTTEVENDGVYSTFYLKDVVSSMKVAFATLPTSPIFVTDLDTRVDNIITYLKAVPTVIGIQAVTTTIIK